MRRTTSQAHVLTIDAQAERYWQFVTPHPGTAIFGLLGTVGVSTDLLAATYDTATRHGLDARAASHAIATNPGCPVSLLRDFLFGDEERVAQAAARNPAVGAWAPELQGSLPAAISSAFLANPACPAELADDPELRAESVHVWENPSVGPKRLRFTLLHGTDAQRSSAVCNPALTDDEVAAALARERRRASRVMRVAERQMKRRRWAADPMNCPARHLQPQRFSRTVADRIDQLAPVVAEAARALHTGGFAGSVGELFDVAESLTS